MDNFTTLTWGRFLTLLLGGILVPTSCRLYVEVVLTDDLISHHGNDERKKRCASVFVVMFDKFVVKMFLKFCVTVRLGGVYLRRISSVSVCVSGGAWYYSLVWIFSTTRHVVLLISHINILDKLESFWKDPSYTFCLVVHSAVNFFEKP
jgi:hypothetical protein